MHVNTKNIVLWHFSDKNAKEFILNPKNFGANSFTKSDAGISKVPRVFFYVNSFDKESFFEGKPLYKAIVPEYQIYDLIYDPLKLKEKHSFYSGINFNELLQELSGWSFSLKSGWIKKKSSFKGVKYRVCNFIVVAWFESINVVRVQNKNVNNFTNLAVNLAV